MRLFTGTTTSAGSGVAQGVPGGRKEEEQFAAPWLSTVAPDAELTIPLVKMASARGAAMD